MFNKKNILLFSLISFVVLLILYLFPVGLLFEPHITPVEYLNSKPYMEVFGFILIVPSSTFWVYVMGIYIVVLGISFLKRNNDPSKWWGLSMVLWGIGALLAGTSYQGLGYELKCNVEEFCLFTSWFELAYLYFTAISISALSVGFSKSVIPKSKRKPLMIYTVVITILYPVILLVGTIFEIKILITYELFTIFFMPLFLVFFAYNIIFYRLKKDDLNKTYIKVWMLFLIVNVSYYVYYFLGITEFLYNNLNIWFSANDVLHVLLLLWMIYIWYKLKPLINDVKK